MTKQIKFKVGGLYYSGGGYFILCWRPDNKYYLIYSKGNITTRGSMIKSEMIKYLQDAEYNFKYIGYAHDVLNKIHDNKDLLK